MSGVVFTVDETIYGSASSLIAIIPKGQHHFLVLRQNICHIGANIIGIKINSLVAPIIDDLEHTSIIVITKSTDVVLCIGVCRNMDFHPYITCPFFIIAVPPCKR